MKCISLLNYVYIFNLLLSLHFFSLEMSCREDFCGKETVTLNLDVTNTGDVTKGENDQESGPGGSVAKSSYETGNAIHETEVPIKVTSSEIVTTTSVGNTLNYSQLVNSNGSSVQNMQENVFLSQLGGNVDIFNTQLAFSNPIQVMTTEGESQIYVISGIPLANLNNSSIASELLLKCSQFQNDAITLNANSASNGERSASGKKDEETQKNIEVTLEDSKKVKNAIPSDESVSQVGCVENLQQVNDVQKSILEQKKKDEDETLNVHGQPNLTSTPQHSADYLEMNNSIVVGSPDVMNAFSKTDTAEEEGNLKNLVNDSKEVICKPEQNGEVETVNGTEEEVKNNSKVDNLPLENKEVCVGENSVLECSNSGQIQGKDAKGDNFQMIPNYDEQLHYVVREKNKNNPGVIDQSMICNRLHAMLNEETDSSFETSISEQDRRDYPRFNREQSNITDEDTLDSVHHFERNKCIKYVLQTVGHNNEEEERKKRKYEEKMKKERSLIESVSSPYGSDINISSDDTNSNGNSSVKSGDCENKCDSLCIVHNGVCKVQSKGDVLKESAHNTTFCNVWVRTVDEDCEKNTSYENIQREDNENECFNLSSVSEKDEKNGCSVDMQDKPSEVKGQEYEGTKRKRQLHM